LSEDIPTKNNNGGMCAIIKCLTKSEKGLIFANLVDFDMLYGHRNDVVGYARALVEFDKWLPQLMDNLSVRDLLIITSDHGCDPTHPGTDHTREYALLLVYGKGIKSGVNLGVRESFADIGQTIAQMLGVAPLGYGESFGERFGCF
jgi:phosphopentomutase